MSWRVAYSLGGDSKSGLLGEINAFAPGRDTASDGSIGDAAHAARTSDHNPWVTWDGVGIVRARDFTHDPDKFPGQALADALEKKMREGHPALRSGSYIIWNHRILSYDRLSEGWRPYTGSNPHEHHVHLSVSTAHSGYDSTAPWNLFEEEDPMADYAAQLDRIEKRQQNTTKALKAVVDAVEAVGEQTEAAKRRIT